MRPARRCPPARSSTRQPPNRPACTQRTTPWGGLQRASLLAARRAGSWGNYADRDEAAPLIATGRTREGRVARRARRREALREKRHEHIAERLARKQMVRAGRV